MEIVKKSGGLEAGYVFAPYVMVENMKLGNLVAQRRMSLMSELWGFTPKEDNVFYQKNSVKSRYTVTQVNNNFYGTIDINKKAD